MSGRLIFWLLLIVVICLLVADVESKKGKKKKHSKEKHSHRSSKKSSRKSSEASDSREWDWNYRPQTNNRRPWEQRPNRGGQITIFRGPNNNRNNDDGIQWWRQGAGNRRTTPTTITTTTPAPWWQRGGNWQGPGQGGWNDRWWVDGNRDRWTGAGYWEDWDQSSSSEDWDDWDDWDEWDRWNKWEEWENMDWDDWDDWSSSEDSSGKSSKKHSHGSKKHSHGSKEKSKKHSHGSKKHSHGSSKSSSKSSEGSSESGEWVEIVIVGAGNYTGIDMNWCRNWCHSFVRQNFYTLFPTRSSWPYNSRWRPTNYNIRRRCNDFIKQYGYYCNTTGGVGPTTTAPTTTTESVGRDYSCRTADDCYYDECCVAFGNIYNKTCTKLSGRNDECSRPEEVYDSDRGVYWQSCPCAYGYECISKWDYIIRKTPESLRGLLRDQQAVLGAEKKCKRSQNYTVVTTTDRPVVTMLPPVEQTTPRGYTEVWNSTGGQVTQPPIRSCRTHIDCDFFQCCIHDDDNTPDVGECRNFSERGNFCTSLNELATTSKLDHCPCQSFLQCKGYTRGLSDQVYYKCG